MDVRDFRSDTVTQPTREMREAMAKAIVGDDTLGEDPTVDELEAYSAELLGKEAGLLTASGTMANQIAVQVMTSRGDEIIVGEETHIFNLEVGGLAALSQVQTRPLRSDQGHFSPGAVKGAIRKTGIQSPRTSLLCLENTYNLNGGIPLRPEYFREMASIAKEHNVRVYLDGARIFNAAAALHVEPTALTEHVDAAMFCLTKGLAAPFGAMLVGSNQFIEQARWIRQRLGGGFRQIGHMAAAGLVGLRKMRGRIPEDHANAQRLAKGLAAIDERLVSVDLTLTNVVHIDFAPVGKTSSDVVEELRKLGIKVKPIGETQCRMITHWGLGADDIDYALEQIKKVIR